MIRTAPVYTIAVTRWDQLFLTLSVWESGIRAPVQFRGDAYWQWNGNPVRAHGSRICWSELLHDTLEGWHSCVLHTRQPVSILPHHSDYPHVARLMRWAQTLTDVEVCNILTTEVTR